MKKSALAAKGTEMKMGQAGDALGHVSGEKMRKLDKFIKNTESRKVPGRESRGFRKGPRKGYFYEKRDKRINSNHQHIYIYGPSGHIFLEDSPYMDLTVHI